MAPLSVFKPDDDPTDVKGELLRVRARQHDLSAVCHQHAWRLEALEARLDKSNHEDYNVRMSKLEGRVSLVQTIVFSFIGMISLAVIGALLKLIIK